VFSVRYEELSFRNIIQHSFHRPQTSDGSIASFDLRINKRLMQEGLDYHLNITTALNMLDRGLVVIIIIIIIIIIQLH